MYYYLLLLIPLIVLFLYFYKHEKNKEKEMMQQVFQKLNQYGSFNNESNEFTINDKVFEIHFFRIPKNAELIINSPRIWEVKTKSSQKLIHQDQLFKNKKDKIILVYPDCQPIKRFINENELVFVKNSFFNQMHVVPVDKLSLLIEEIKNK